jgi:hypothetical protein
MAHLEQTGAPEQRVQLDDRHRQNLPRDFGQWFRQDFGRPPHMPKRDGRIQTSGKPVVTERPTVAELLWFRRRFQLRLCFVEPR